jgi:hypothetical protein
MTKLLARALKYILIGAVVLYFADWAALGIKLARHTGMGSVNVSQYLATPLKGQKEEYDYLGAADQSSQFRDALLVAGTPQEPMAVSERMDSAGGLRSSHGLTGCRHRL